MIAEWLIFFSICISVPYILQTLRQIAEHLLRIRELCADMEARQKMEAMRSHSMLP